MESLKLKNISETMWSTVALLPVLPTNRLNEVGEDFQDHLVGPSLYHQYYH